MEIHVVGTSGALKLNTSCPPSMGKSRCKQIKKKKTHLQLYIVNYYSGSSFNGHPCKRTAPLTAAFTKPYFSQLKYKFCIFIFCKLPAPVTESDFVTNSYEKSWDSSCEKSRVPVHNQ